MFKIDQLLTMFLAPTLNKKELKMYLNRKLLFVMFMVLAVVLGACSITVPPVVEVDTASSRALASASEMSAPMEETDTSEAEVEIIKFDVAEDMYRFVFDESKVFDDGLPAHGSSFITQGYIYEYGTLNDSNGVLADGSPEFPDKVIGKWVCRGWFIGDAAHAQTGPWVITTQIYDLGDELGNETLVTDGYELADLNVAIQRAITGGTGQYAQARGEAFQELLGLNATEGVNLRFELQVTK